MMIVCFLPPLFSLQQSVFRPSGCGDVDVCNIKNKIYIYIQCNHHIDQKRTDSYKETNRTEQKKKNEQTNKCIIK